MNPKDANALRDKLVDMCNDPDAELPTFTSRELSALVMVSVSGLMHEIDNLRTICQMLEAVVRLNAGRVDTLAAQVNNLAATVDSIILTGNT